MSDIVALTLGASAGCACVTFAVFAWVEQRESSRRRIAWAREAAPYTCEAAPHGGFFLTTGGVRYWTERGFTWFDVTDPARPREVGYGPSGSSMAALEASMSALEKASYLSRCLSEWQVAQRVKP